MKRNWDTIRIILEKVEAGELPVYLEKETYLDSGMSEDDVLGHIEIMLDAGILQNGKITRGWAGSKFMARDGRQAVDRAESAEVRFIHDEFQLRISERWRVREREATQ